MANLFADLRYAARLLVRSPGFTIVAVLTLALGIGANTAIFSVVNAVLIRSLPYKDASRLVQVWDTQPQVPLATVSFPEYLDWKEQAQVFDSLATYCTTLDTLTGQGDPEQVPALRVSADLLPTLGLTPLLGRQFRQEEEQPGSEPVVMISHALWQRRFDGDPNVLGRALIVNGEAFTVIAVFPADLRLDGQRDLIRPLRFKPESVPRGMHFLTVLGRLRADLSLQPASAEMEAAAARLRDEKKTDHGVTLVPYLDQIVGRSRPTLLVLLATVGFILAIGCANLANLLLARGAARRKEIAIRLAVGASRGRLIRQFLTESTFLSLIGGGVGLLLAVWGVDLLVAALPADFPRRGEIGVDTATLLFTLGISLITGLLFGLAPALNLLGGDLNDPLKGGGRETGVAPLRSGARRALIVAEVALALILLVGAGLLTRSLGQVLGVPKGFDPRGVLTMEILLPQAKYPDKESHARFFRDLARRFSALPGVAAVGVVSHIPLSGSNTDGGFAIEGRTFPPNDKPTSAKRFASAGYFKAMGIPLVRGRFFTEQDEGGAPVVVINETLARRFFPGQDPVGKRVDFAWGTNGMQEIVGVVGDLRHDGLDLPVLAEMYVPFEQRPDLGMILGENVVVKGSGGFEALAAAVRLQVRAVDSDQPISNLQTMEAFVAASTRERRLLAWLVGGFAALAILLAATGLYGVMSFAVAQRRHEMGVRIALGARGRDISALIVGEAMRLTIGGILLGCAGALVLTRAISGMLYEVSAVDPATFSAVPALVAAVGLLAAYLPARRASRVDPMTVLRSE